MNGLKIAVLISGRITTDMKQYENFMKMYGKYKPDIFVSHSKGYSQQTIEKFIEMYKPKNIIENDEIFPTPLTLSKPKETNPHNVMCMFQNRLRCLILLQNYNKKYDIVVSTRCDIMSENFIEFENYLEKGVYIPSGNDWLKGLNDQFAFGDQNNMEIYLGLFLDIDEIMKTGIIFHPETILRKYTEMKNIYIRRFKLDYYLNRDLKEIV